MYSWTRRFSPLDIRQPRCLTRLVLRDDRTRTSCPRRLTATKVAIDRYFSKKTPPRTTRDECGRDGGIRTTTTTTSYRLHATRRFTRCTGTGSSSSSSNSSGSTIRGWEEYIAGTPGESRLYHLPRHPSRRLPLSFYPLLEWRHGNGVGDRSRTPT